MCVSEHVGHMQWRELDEKGSNGVTPNVIIVAASTGHPPDLRLEVWRSRAPEV